jgi:hypothetical protein
VQELTVSNMGSDASVVEDDQRGLTGTLNIDTTIPNVISGTIVANCCSGREKKTQ